jgi:hypothetical protein
VITAVVTAEDRDRTKARGAKGKEGSGSEQAEDGGKKRGDASSGRGRARR